MRDDSVFRAYSGPVSWVYSFCDRQLRTATTANRRIGSPFHRPNVVRNLIGTRAVNEPYKPVVDGRAYVSTAKYINIKIVFKIYIFPRCRVTVIYVPYVLLPRSCYDGTYIILSEVYNISTRFINRLRDRGTPWPSGRRCHGTFPRTARARTAPPARPGCSCREPVGATRGEGFEACDPRPQVPSRSGRQYAFLYSR